MKIQTESLLNQESVNRFVVLMVKKSNNVNKMNCKTRILGQNHNMSGNELPGGGLPEFSLNFIIAASNL